MWNIFSFVNKVIRPASIRVYTKLRGPLLILRKAFCSYLCEIYCSNRFHDRSVLFFFEILKIGSWPKRGSLHWLLNNIKNDTSLQFALPRTSILLLLYIILLNSSLGHFTGTSFPWIFLPNYPKVFPSSWIPSLLVSCDLFECSCDIAM